MSAIDFAQVRNQVSMEQVLVLLNFVPTSRRGSCLRGRCPMCVSIPATFAQAEVV